MASKMVTKRTYFRFLQKSTTLNDISCIKFLNQNFAKYRSWQDMLYTINLCKVLVVFFSENHITYIVKHNFLKGLLLHVVVFLHTNFWKWIMKKRILWKTHVYLVSIQWISTRDTWSFLCIINLELV